MAGSSDYAISTTSVENRAFWGGDVISVVMAYWCRSQILLSNLARYRELYAKSDIEITIVDDGSPDRAQAEGPYPWPVRILRMPEKMVALNPSVPLNIGAHKSSGEFLLLTSPEVMHRTAILDEMARRLKEMGPRSYLAAACWSPARKKWYCHSAHKTRGPVRSGLHFCAMLPLALYNEIGGFDEKYRQGQAYEDVDFLWRLHAAGVRCEIADDLITDHIKTARSNWVLGGHDRNRRIFMRRWGKQLLDA